MKETNGGKNGKEEMEEGSEWKKIERREGNGKQGLEREKDN